MDIKNIVEQLGYEVEDINVEPVFVDDKFIGLSVRVKPKVGAKIINSTITITNNGNATQNGNNK